MAREEMDPASAFSATPNSGPGMRQGKAASRVALIRGLQSNLNDAFGRAFPGKTPVRSVGDGLSAGGDGAILTRFLEASAEATMIVPSEAGESPIPASMAVLRAHEERLFGSPCLDVGSPMDVSPCVEDRSLAALASEKHVGFGGGHGTGTSSTGMRQLRTVQFDEGVPYVPSRMRVSGMPGDTLTAREARDTLPKDFKVPVGGAMPVSMTPSTPKAGRRAALGDSQVMRTPASRDLDVERARAGEARALRELENALVQMEEERDAQEKRLNAFRKESTREKRDLINALQAAQELAAGGGAGQTSPAGGWEARARSLEVELDADRQQARHDAKLKTAEIFDLRKRAQKAEQALAEARKLMAVEREDADKSIASLQKRLSARKNEVGDLKREVDALRSAGHSVGLAERTLSESSGIVSSPATTSAGDSPGGRVGEESATGSEHLLTTLPKNDLERLRRQARTSTELASQVRELTRARSELEARVAELDGQLDKAQRSRSARPNREELMRVANLATETLFRELQLGGQTPSLAPPAPPGMVH